MVFESINRSVNLSVFHSVLHSIVAQPPKIGYNIQRCGAVAHRLEQAAHNHLVVGSIPTSPTIETAGLLACCFYGAVCTASNQVFAKQKMVRRSERRTKNTCIFLQANAGAKRFPTSRTILAKNPTWICYLTWLLFSPYSRLFYALRHKPCLARIYLPFWTLALACRN